MKYLSWSEKDLEKNQEMMDQEGPPYTWRQNFVYARWLLQENVAARGGHWNMHRVWYWTFVYLKYMFGVGADIE